MGNQHWAKVQIMEGLEQLDNALCKAGASRSDSADEPTWEAYGGAMWVQLSEKDGRIYFSVGSPSLRQSLENWDVYLNEQGISFAVSRIELYANKINQIFVVTTVNRLGPFRRETKQYAYRRNGVYYVLTADNISDDEKILSHQLLNIVKEEAIVPTRSS
jgi:hypothetical protein